MRILVHEFASGGGLAGRAVPRSLAREGSAMRAALLADLAAGGHHEIVTTADPRFQPDLPLDVEVVTLSEDTNRREARLSRLIADADAVWFIAPETGRCLERLATTAESYGTRLLGSGSATIRKAADKAGFRFACHGVPYPTTRVLQRHASWTQWRSAAEDMGYPVVVKPRRGAGCEGVSLVRHSGGLRRAVSVARQVDDSGALLLQRFVPGVAASVSLLANGERVMALAVNAQSVRGSPSFHYHGGTTPFDHPLVGRAIDVALDACEALPGLRGYVGVDLVLTDSDAVVIEVNPRLTTSYIGIRAALEDNVAALVLDACRGVLPPSVAARQRVQFTSSGQIVSATPVVSRA